MSEGYAIYLGTLLFLTTEVFGVGTDHSTPDPSHLPNVLS